MTASLAELTAALAGRLEETNEALAGFRDLLRSAEAEQKNLTVALRALDPDNPLVAKEEKKPTPTPAAPARPPARQQVSEVLIARVRQALAQHPVPLTIGEIQGVVPVTDSAISSALKILRERGQVRLAGTAQRQGKPNLWASMNGEAS